MSTQVIGWPHHGHAVNARNDTADYLIGILDECEYLLALLVDEGADAKTVAAVAKVQRKAAGGLLLMVQQGAPVHPSRLQR